MGRLTQKQIEETFAVLGLDNEDTRSNLHMLERLGKQMTSKQIFIRLSDSSQEEENAHAQLARTARRD